MEARLAVGVERPLPTVPLGGDSLHLWLDDNCVALYI